MSIMSMRMKLTIERVDQRKQADEQQQEDGGRHQPVFEVAVGMNGGGHGIGTILVSSPSPLWGGAGVGMVAAELVDPHP